MSATRDDTLSSLLALALAAPKRHVAWVSSTVQMSRHRAREATRLLSQEGRAFKYVQLDHTIRLHNGSQLIFTTPEDIDRLRGLNLTAVAVRPPEDTARVMDLLKERLLRAGGELIR